MDIKAIKYRTKTELLMALARRREKRLAALSKLAEQGRSQNRVEGRIGNRAGLAG